MSKNGPLACGGADSDVHHRKSSPPSNPSWGVNGPRYAHEGEMDPVAAASVTTSVAFDSAVGIDVNDSEGGSGWSSGTMPNLRAKMAFGTLHPSGRGIGLVSRHSLEDMTVSKPRIFANHVRRSLSGVVDLLQSATLFEKLLRLWFEKGNFTLVRSSCLFVSPVIFVWSCLVPCERVVTLISFSSTSLPLRRYPMFHCISWNSFGLGLRKGRVPPSREETYMVWSIIQILRVLIQLRSLDSVAVEAE
jgi:hypothetical protein